MKARSRPCARVQLPDPCRLWIRYVPRRWPWPDAPCLDLSSLELSVPRASGEEDGEEILGDLESARFDDVLYLPSVERHLEEQRRELAATHLERGTPVLVQVRPGEESVPDGCIGVLDLLPLWLGPGRERWRSGDAEGTAGGDRSLPAGVVCAVVPLVPGLGPQDFDELSRLCEWLAACGVEVAQGVAVKIEPSARRALADARENASFLDLFHGESLSERAVAIAARRVGMEPFLERPVPRPPLLAGNERLAGGLALAAELAARLGRPAREQEALVRAARWSERTGRDLAALHRDRNLGVLPWLETPARHMLVELIEEDLSPTLDRWLREYSGGETTTMSRRPRTPEGGSG